jgi:hypothetical protein
LAHSLHIRGRVGGSLLILLCRYVVVQGNYQVKIYKACRVKSDGGGGNGFILQTHHFRFSCKNAMKLQLI